MITTATHKDLAWLLDQQAKHGEELGFLPQCVTELAIEEQRILLHQSNDDPVSFIMLGTLKPETYIYQACTQTDAQRERFATALADYLRDVAKTKNVEKIILACAADLDANKFWTHAGWQLTGTKRPKNRRKREINCYTLTLPRFHQVEAKIDELIGDLSKHNLLKGIGMYQEWRDRLRPRARAAL